MVHAHRPVDGRSTTVSDVVHDGVSARHQVRRRCRTSYRMTSIIPSFVLVDSNNLAKDRYCEVHRNGMVVISLVSGTPDPSRCLRDLWWRPRDLDPTSHPEIQEMQYSTSMMCSVVLVTCTRLPACCMLCISWYWAQAQQGRARWCPSAPGYPSCHPRCHPSDVSSGGHGWTHGSDLSS